MRTIAWPLPRGCTHADPVGPWPRPWGLGPLLLACLPAALTDSQPRRAAGISAAREAAPPETSPLPPSLDGGYSAPLASAGAASWPRGRERREAEDAARAAPWGPEDGVTAQPAMPDGSPPGRPDSAEPWAFAATPGAQRPLPSDPSSRGPRRLGSTRTPKAPLTLTLFLSPRVGAVTNSRSTLPTPREADRPGEDGVGARE